MARAQATMEVFAHFAAASGIGPECVVPGRDERDPRRDQRRASSSTRAEAATGLTVRVLAREEEARYGYLAAVNATTLSDGVMLDIGGGSMQLVHVAGRHSRELDSWPLGAVRVTERFLDDDGPAKPKALKEVRAHVARKLERAGVAEVLGRPPGRHRRHRAQPRRRGAARPRHPGVRRRRLRALAQGARPARRRARRALAEGPRQGAGHQARARRPHPRRRARRADGDGGGRLPRPGGHRGRPARGRVLRALPARRPAAVRGRPPRERGQPRRPVRHVARDQSARRPRRRARARRCSTISPPPACIPATPSSASCCGPARCCTTSA